jgi:hypothetical protein
MCMLEEEKRTECFSVLYLCAKLSGDTYELELIGANSR